MANTEEEAPDTLRDGESLPPGTVRTSELPTKHWDRTDEDAIPTSPDGSGEFLAVESDEADTGS